MPTLHANVDFVTLTNTFDEWRTRTNDLIQDRNQLRNYEYLKDESNFRVANGAIYISRATGGTTLINDNDAQISNTLYVLKDTITTRNVNSGNVNTGNIHANIVYSNNVINTERVSTSSLVVDQTANIEFANIATAEALSVIIDPDDSTYGIFSPGIGRFRHLEVDAGGLAYTGDITSSSDTITLRDGLGTNGSGYFEVEQATGNASIRYNSTADQWEASNNDVTGTYSKLIRQIDIASITSGVSGNLIFSQSESLGSKYRVLTHYADDSANVYTVRSATCSGSLVIELSSFTPGFSSQLYYGSSQVVSGTLLWDVPLTGFSVSSSNPSDWTTDYTTSVNSITASVGSVSALNTFSTSGPTPTPGGGVYWTQTFSTDADSYIRPNATGLTGGTVTASVKYDALVEGVTGLYTYGGSTMTASWGVPTQSFSIAPLGSKIFLQTFTSTTYSGSGGGLSNTSNIAHAITPTGGTLSTASATGTSISGTFTFTTPVTCNSSVAGKSLTLDTTYSRPAAVTGTAYTAVKSITASATGGSFTYPSFWLFTAAATTIPSRTNIVNGSTFTGTGESLTILGDQAGFSGSIENSNPPAGNAKYWWFGKLSTATQPVLNDGTGTSNIKYGTTGSNAQNLSTAAVYDGGTVTLHPDGATDLQRVYHLYGIRIPANTTAYIIVP